MVVVFTLQLQCPISIVAIFGLIEVTLNITRKAEKHKYASLVLCGNMQADLLKVSSVLLLVTSC